MGAKAKGDYAPTMRRALFQGLRIAAIKQGLTLPEMTALWWEEDWKKAADVMTKFLPREHTIAGKVKHEHTHELVPQTLIFIEGVLGEGADDALKMVGPERPVLPVALPVEQT